MTPRSIHIATAIAVTLLGAAPVAAQCPDGSPPPCGRRVAARAVNPPLDDRTWIVVPFDNLARNADAEWLRNASVNLLYLDMSRWQDIRVIDDERVADLVRETTEAAKTQQLSLTAGLAVAKRAGAGKLVMGDVVKLGERTSVTAKIFDVRTGQRVRSVKEDALVQDSVMSLFGKLAQRILNVAPPEGARLGAIGTTRTDAYQEYLAGLSALHRFELSEAKRRLTRALALDSTFALAHYKMAVVIGWDDPNDPAYARHAARAARFQAGLPTRIRNLITGIAHQAAREWKEACAVFSGVVRADSADVDGWYGLGECLFHDGAVEMVGGDSSHMRFRADWQSSIRAFRRVLELDPQYHLAYQHIIDALSVERKNGSDCESTPQRCIFFASYVIRSGDSLVMTPVRANDVSKLRQQGDSYWAAQSRRRNLAEAERVGREWMRVAPAESRARDALAGVFVAQGRLEAAQTLLHGSTASASLVEEARRTLSRMEIAYKLGDGSEARRLYDSVRTANGPLPSGGPQRLGNAISGYAVAFGRFTEWDSLVSAGMTQQNAPPLVQHYRQLATRAALGGSPNDEFPTVERDLFAQVNGTRGATAATRVIAVSLMYWLRGPRQVWPALDTTMRDVKLRPAIALARSDTIALRAAARSLDSLLSRLASDGGNDTGFTLAGAEAYLALHDTASALKTVRLGLDSAMATSPYFPVQSNGITAVVYAPRLMLLRADLAAARGFRPEARIWYQRFIDVWAAAVAEFQPMVARARHSLEALGPP